jgi:predicted acylesterase/phospholipase RssA/CRP-like cAMP-binding protein
MASDDSTPHDESSGGRKPAEALLLLIENQTAHQIGQVQKLIERYFVQEGPDTAERRYFDSFKVQRKRERRLTIVEIERYAPHWAALVPDDPAAQAGLVFRLGQKYKFTRKMIPQIVQTLKLDDPAVQKTYQAAYGQPLESVYAPDLTEPPPDWTAAWEVSHLSVYTLHDIERAVEWVNLARGEVLFRQGEPGDSLYVITNGRLRVLVGGEQDRRTVDELGRGETVGEMAVITGERRSATVIAVRDTELIRLSREALDRLAKQNPQLMMPIARSVLVRVSRQATSARKGPHDLATVAVIPTGADVPLEDFARRLAAALEPHGSALHLNAQMVDDRLGAGMANASADNSRLIAWLSEEECSHRFVIYQADSHWSEWTQRCIRQADRVILVGVAGGDPKPGEIETRMAALVSAELPVRCELALLHSEQDGAQARTWLADRTVAQHYHVSSDQDFARIARFLTGQALGVVLGGGGVRAFAHIGVLRALRELGLVPDMIAGASAGALAAAGYAIGYDVETIRMMAKDLIFDRKAGIDYTLPLVALMGAGKLNRAITAICGEHQIEDLHTPYFCVTANLTNAELAVHRAGSLRRAVRASMSLPGVYPPVSLEGQLHVDGGVLNNLPTNIMNDFVEGGPVIGVDVSPKSAQHTYYKYPDSVSGWTVLNNRINPFTARQRFPTLLKTLLRTITIASTGARPMQAEYADVLVELPLHEFGLLAFDSLNKLVEIGYRTTLTKLAEWKERRGLGK